MQSLLAIDAHPFPSVAEALRWAFLHLRGPEEFDAVYVSAERMIPRPCHPQKIKELCDEAIRGQSITGDTMSEEAIDLIRSTAYGFPTPETLASAAWREVEEALGPLFRQHGIL